MKKGICYLFFTAIASVVGYMLASRNLEDKRDFR